MYALEIKAHDLQSQIMMFYVVILPSPLRFLNITVLNGVLLYKFFKIRAGKAICGCPAFLFFWNLLNPHVTVQ